MFDLDAAVATLRREGKLATSTRYSKSDLMPIFATAGLDAEAFFTVFRGRVARGASVGGETVRVLGQKRGTRYVFGAESEDPVLFAPPRAQSLEPAHTRPPSPNGTIEIHVGDNASVLPLLQSASFDLIYIDPPFNTGRVQARTQLRTERNEDGDRVGFKGNRYKTIRLGTKRFVDTFDDYLEFLEPRLREAHRLLKGDGSFFLHLDYREVHYAKVLLDSIFGRECFMNEIIWAYDYGARATKRWSAKHDNILWYAKDPERYTFQLDEVDRIPYMAPGLVGEEKAARGKTPTDTWWHTIVSPTGKEKTGYPTQKPLGVLSRLIKVHCRLGDRVLDFFAGSGTTGEAAAIHGRHAVLVDDNPEAIEVMTRRLGRFSPRLITPSPLEPVAAPTG
jgi:site-specific DNA-methyltransferase (adenine-specific)